MNKQSCMKGLLRSRGRLLWMLIPTIFFSNLCFGESDIGRLSASNETIQDLPVQYFSHSHSPFPVYPIPIYPDVQWLYPCFPFVSCMVRQQYRKYDRRNKQRLKRLEPISGQGAPQVDQAMKAWRAGLLPAVEPSRTDERQIVPAFREHSLIRPKYQKAGSILPELSPDKK